MLGENCAVFGCGSRRRKKVIGIWKLLKAKDESYAKWRDEWLGEIKKTRDLDQSFKELIKNDRVFTCEKHFAAEDVEIFVSEKQTKKKPRFGALPLLNMPKKSHETAKPPPRSYRWVVKDLTPSLNSVYYKTFSELCQRIEQLKSLSEWSYKIFPERVVVRKQDDHFQLPEVEIIIDDYLSFTVKAFGSYLVEDHELYLKYKRSMRNITVSMLVNDLKSYKLCGGVNPTEITSKLFHHVVPLNQDLTGDEDSEQFPHKGYWRVKGCVLLEDPPENGGLLFAHIILSSPTMVFLC